MFDKRPRNATSFTSGEVDTVYKPPSMGNKLLSREAVDKNLLRLTDKRLDGIKLVGVRYDKQSQTWLARSTATSSWADRNATLGGQKRKSGEVSISRARSPKKK